MNGIIIVDKPRDFTSFDVVAKLRGVLGERRLGHGGTLDPMATGVLPVFAGTATKAADIAPRADKRYTAVVRLGFCTDTGDITGRITARDGRVCTPAELETAAGQFRGKTRQLPPMYSAVKVNGQRLYKLARQGREIEREPRDIEIYSLEIGDFDPVEGSFTLEVHCSKGTYVRALAEDIARRAGCLGTLGALRRTMSSGFGEGEAHSLAEIERLAQDGGLEDIVLPVERLFVAYVRAELDEGLARLFLNGVDFAAARLGADIAPGPVAVYRGPDFLGLARCDGGKIHKLKQFYFENRHS